MGSKVARSIALRELLETALFREAEIFGSIIKEGLDNNANFEKSKDELLMFQNHKQVYSQRKKVGKLIKFVFMIHKYVIGTSDSVDTKSYICFSRWNNRERRS